MGRFLRSPALLLLHPRQGFCLFQPFPLDHFFLQPLSYRIYGKLFMTSCCVSLILHPYHSHLLHAMKLMPLSFHLPLPKRGRGCLNFLALFPFSDTRMLKLPFHHTSLGVHLQRERQDRQLTQSNLAQQAQIAIPTLRLLEHGQGNLTSFWTVLHTLNLDIVGCNLPPGESIRAQIITLRKRKGISQRDLIKLVGVSQPTLIELERHCTGRLQTLERVLTILGAGAYLAPTGNTKAFYAHAGNSSTSET